MRNELGRLPRTFDQRIPHLSSVRLMGGIQLPALPNEIDNAIGLPADLGIMLNDRLGDCTSAGAYHAVQVWTQDAAGAMLTEPDEMVVQFYSEATGYNPADMSTDQGGNEQAVLTRWLNAGLPMADGSRSKLSAFVEVDPRNLRDVCEAIYECGLVYIGFNVPELLPEDGGAVWATTTDLGPIVGGHCVILTGYSAPSNPVFDVISWGQRFQMTASFWRRYCVAPRTKILTADLRWAEAGDLRLGDQVLGFDEQGPNRRWKSAIVLATDIVERPCYDLFFDDGTEVRCSGEHQWLGNGHGGGARWIETARMKNGPQIFSRVVKPVDVWGFDNSREAGYIAAALDGEGSLSQMDLHGIYYGVAAGSPVVFQNGAAQIGITFSQKDNAMLKEMRRCLDRRGFMFSDHHDKGGVRRLAIRRKSDVLRTLGEIRPLRLLEKFNPNLIGGMRQSKERPAAKLIRKTDVGVQRVVALKTTSRTYIAEGLASHNCDECYALASPLWINAAGRTPWGLDPATLAGIMQAIREPTP